MSQGKLPKLSEETVNRFLTAQAKEQEIKIRELEIRQREVNAQADFAQKMLKAQVGDRESERNHEHRLYKMRLLFGGLILFILLIFLGFTVWRGFAQEALDLAKTAITYVLAAVGGYGLRVIHDKRKPQEKELD